MLELAKVGSEVDVPAIAHLMPLEKELRHARAGTLDAASEAANQEFARVLGDAKPAFAAAQVGDRSAHAVFCDALQYVLRAGPQTTKAICDMPSCTSRSAASSAMTQAGEPGRSDGDPQCPPSSACARLSMPRRGIGGRRPRHADGDEHPAAGRRRGVVVRSEATPAHGRRVGAVTPVAAVRRSDKRLGQRGPGTGADGAQGPRRHPARHRPPLELQMTAASSKAAATTTSSAKAASSRYSQGDSSSLVDASSIAASRQSCAIQPRFRSQPAPLREFAFNAGVCPMATASPSPDNVEQSCGNCRYWLQTNETHGHRPTRTSLPRPPANGRCRRFPPFPADDGIYPSRRTRHPLTHAESWCGEWAVDNRP